METLILAALGWVVGKLLDFTWKVLKRGIRSAAKKSPFVIVRRARMVELQLKEELLVLSDRAYVEAKQAPLILSEQDRASDGSH